MAALSRRKPLALQPGTPALDEGASRRKTDRRCSCFRLVAATPQPPARRRHCLEAASPLCVLTSRAWSGTASASTCQQELDFSTAAIVLDEEPQYQPFMQDWRGGYVRIAHPKCFADAEGIDALLAAMEREDLRRAGRL